jgi:hypothetical protein
MLHTRRKLSRAQPHHPSSVHLLAASAKCTAVSPPKCSIVIRCPSDPSIKIVNLLGTYHLLICRQATPPGSIRTPPPITPDYRSPHKTKLAIQQLPSTADLRHGSLPSRPAPRGIQRAGVRRHHLNVEVYRNSRLSPPNIRRAKPTSRRA